MAPGRSLASLELANENDEGNHGDGQPADHSETIHEREKRTLVQELLIPELCTGLMLCVRSEV
jgi:hypothetical protein